MRRLVGGLALLGLVSPAFIPWLQPAHAVLVTIPEGVPAREVAARLAEAGLSPSAAYLRALLALRPSWGRHLQAGAYRLSAWMPAETILRSIAEGRGVNARVTIPEGLSARQIAARLAAAGLGDEKEFVEIIQSRKWEGRLFPETYVLRPGQPPEKILQRLVMEFDRRYTPDLRARAKALGFTDLQALTLASLVEREARTESDRHLIAGVFHNRLKKRWLLESCASVQYALGEWKPRLTYQDLKVKSPYNTYEWPGLPPGPICSPGLPSIHAALYPAATDAMFFVISPSSGTHVFSRYYRDHLKVRGRRPGRHT